MSNEHSKYACLDEFREDLMRAAQAAPRSRPRSTLRRLALPLSGLALALGGGAVGVAVAGGGDSGVSIEPGITLGYVDQASGEALRCADGELLSSVIGESPSNPGDAAGELRGSGGIVVPEPGEMAPVIERPLCEDGTVPPRYLELLQAGGLSVFEIR